MFKRATTLAAYCACFFALAATAAAAIPTPSVVSTSTGSVNYNWSGGVQPYTAVISTSFDFSCPVSSGSVGTAAINYPGLNPNTTYYFRVKVTADPEDQYSTRLTTSTWVYAPTALYFIPNNFVSESSFTALASLGWDTGNNPDWTTYELEQADDNTFIPALTLTRKTNTTNVGGLNANTTYYFKLRARGVSGTVTDYTPYIDTATLSVKLSGFSSVVSDNDATISWVKVNDPSINALKATGYHLVLSTSQSMVPITTDLVNPDPDTPSIHLTPLTANTTYYYRAGTLNTNGVSNMSDNRSFTTLAPIPAGLKIITVADGSAKLGWTALAPGAALGYKLEASTDNFTGPEIALSSVSYGVAISTLSIPTLDPNTTYYFRVSSLNSAEAQNHGTSLSTVTLTLPLSPLGELLQISHNQHNMTASFAGGLFPETPQAFACEGYIFDISTAAFGSGGTILSSVTYQRDLSVLNISGLGPNVLYYLRIGTLNWEFTPNYTYLDPARTDVPGPLSNVLLAGVWLSSASINFTPAGDADGYVAEASEDQHFSPVFKSSATAAPLASNLVITGLNPNTQYYYRAGALFNGATVYMYTIPERQSTLATPLTLSDPPFAGVFFSSVSLTWGALPANSAASYRIEAAATAAFSPVLFSSSSPNMSLSTLTLTGLTPNTSYYFRAGTVNLDNTPNYYFTPATATLAAMPTEQPYTGLRPTSITLNWLANLNPADTLYIAELDTDPGFGSPASSATVLSSATFTGLIPATVYHARVTAYNRLNRMTPTVPFADMATGAYDPVLPGYTDIGVTSMTVNWGPGLNPVNNYYRAQISSSTNFSGVVLSSITIALDAVFNGLVSNASYYLRVSALNLTGVATDPAVPSAAPALTLPATAYMLPLADAFSNPLIDGFTVSWLANGNSSLTMYNVQASTMEDFSVITSSRVAPDVTCKFSDLLIDTTYWVQVQAKGQGGVLTPYETVGSTWTTPYSLLNSVALQDSIIFLDTSYGRISVHMPAGSVGGSTRLTLQPKTLSRASAKSAVSELTPTGIGIAITYFPPVLILNAITITLPYRQADLPAYTDKSKLILALFDETNALWVPLPSASDIPNNRVIGQTWHLSTFQIMQAKSESGLGDVKIYPNPYRPNSVADVMHFTNMTPYAKVRIYTFIGELVREIKADVNGMAHWDGLNGDKRKAASGVYIAFIQTADKKSSKSFKVALER